MKPLFSVLIANYNNGKYIEDCLNSIFAQTYLNWEIIIVDDASTDISKEIYQKYVKNPRIRIYFNAQNKGCGYSKRKCVEYANGEICGFVDPDDAITPEAVEVMVDNHQKLVDCSIINSKFYITDVNLNITKEGTFGAKIPAGESYLTYGNYAIHHFATFKRNMYFNTKGINPELKVAVDQDLYYKLEEVGGTFFLEKFLYKYRPTTQSISLNENAMKAIKSHEEICKETYLRRIKNRTMAANLNPEAFKSRIYELKKLNMIHATKNRNYKIKYKLLLQCFFMYPFKHPYYLTRCLLIPSFS